MASEDEYRQAAVGVSAALVGAANVTLDAVGPERLRWGFDAWLEAYLPLVRQGALVQDDLARRFYEVLRSEEGFRQAMPQWQSVEWNPEPVRRSLYATGGRLFQHLERYELTPAEALGRAKTAMAGAVVRHTMNAGRDSVQRTAMIDPEAKGCLYVTARDDRVCYWCAMLAGRGPVFKGNSFDESNKRFTGWGTAKTHDLCRCVLIPIARLDGERIQRSKDLYAEWESVNYDGKGRALFKNNKDALNRWRRFWVSR